MASHHSLPTVDFDIAFISPGSLLFISLVQYHRLPLCAIFNHSLCTSVHCRICGSGSKLMLYKHLVQQLCEGLVWVEVLSDISELNALIVLTNHLDADGAV